MHRLTHNLLNCKQILCALQGTVERAINEDSKAMWQNDYMVRLRQKVTL